MFSVKLQNNHSLSDIVFGPSSKPAINPFSTATEHHTISKSKLNLKFPGSEILKEI
jgi:hypothetical protein